MVFVVALILVQLIITLCMYALLASSCTYNNVLRITIHYCLISDEEHNLD